MATTDSVKFTFVYYQPNASAVLDTCHIHIYSAIDSSGSAKWTSQAVDSFDYVNSATGGVVNFASKSYAYSALGWKKMEGVLLKFSIYNSHAVYLKELNVRMQQR